MIASLSSVFSFFWKCFFFAVYFLMVLLFLPILNKYMAKKNNVMSAIITMNVRIISLK
jgi:hypothetical protein